MSHEDFFKALNINKVRYIVIGGYAVNYYGYNRMTEDLDILIEPTKKNGENLLNALKDIEFDVDKFRDQDFSRSIHLRLGDPPNTIDIINETKGLDLNKVFNKALLVIINGVKIPIISIEDLIANKKALNTFKDLADAEMLLKIRRRN